MEQETMAAPESGTSTEAAPAPEAEQPDESINLDAPADEQPQEESQAPVEDEFEDYEWEGKSFKAPKGYREWATTGIMKNADYTKKTMAHAETVKQWQSSIEANQSFTKDVGRLMVMDDQLNEFGKVDWQTLSAQDPNRAQSLYFQYQQLRDNRTNLAQDLTTRSQQQAAKAEQDIANRISQDLAMLAKPDPNSGWDGKFTPERRTKLDNFAESLGYSPEERGRVTARDVKTLHLAQLGLETLKKQQVLAKPPVIEAQPVPKISKGGGNATSDPRHMSMERYAEWRANGGGGKSSIRGPQR